MRPAEQPDGRRAPAAVRNGRSRAALVCVLLLAPLAALGAVAPDVAATPVASKGAGFALARHVIAGGGGTSSGGAFAISGTIGQADADPLHPAAGGVFAISGGFWPGVAPAAAPAEPIFANGFETAPP